MELVKKLMKEADPQELERQANNMLMNLTQQTPEAIANRTLNLLGDSLEVDAYHGGNEHHPMLLDENDSVFLT